MINNENISIAEKLLRTDLMELLGGKTTLPSEYLVPPTVPPLIQTGGDGNGNSRLPELRSEAVNEVLAAPPTWLVRWGITLFFSILVLLLGITRFVKYPELIKGNMVIVSADFPKTVVAKANGKLVQLFVKDNQQVVPNETLGLIESTANYQEVLLLENQINNFLSIAQDGSIEKLRTSELPLYFQLGELQKAFQGFQDNFVKTKAYLNEGAYRAKKGMLATDLQTMRKIEGNLKSQLDLLKTEMEMANEQVATQKRLEAKGFVAQKDVQAAILVYLSKKQAYEQAKNTIDNNQLSVNQKKHELIDTDRQILEQKNSLIQSITILKSEIEIWKQTYLLKAPSSGKIVFASPIQENVQLKSGQELFFVQPANDNYYGEVKLGQYNLGRIAQDQEVIVKLVSYPYQEFGIIRGTVEKIADLPKDSTYLIQITFPNRLTTDANKEIPFKNGMTASAEIITEEMSLFDRFFMELRKMIK